MVFGMGAMTVLLSLMGCPGGEDEERVVTSFVEELDATAITWLTVGVEEGDLSIGSGPGDQIVAEAELVTTEDSEEYDSEAKTTLVVQLREMEQGEAILSVMDPDLDGYRVNVVVSIPSALQVSAVSEGGEVLIEDTGPLDLVDGDGDIEIRGIRGDVLVDDGDGDLTISDVVGDVEVHDEDGDITIENVDGDVDIYDGEGSVNTSGVSGALNLHDDE